MGRRVECRNYLRVSLLVAFFVVTALANSQQVFYVSEVSSGTGDGSSWANASSNLGGIIASASAGDEIYLETGTYNSPHFGAANTANSHFFVNKAVLIYGGFNGEATPEERALNSDKPWDFTNPTIFDAGAGKRVVELNNGAAIDGVTISGGELNGDGGGIHLTNSIAINCIIQNNTANTGGGVILYDNSQLSYSLVLNNQTRVGGPNGGRTGGGVTIANDGPSLLGCFVTNNLSHDQGGGLYFQGVGEVVNCVINNNASIDGTNGRGGGVFFSERGKLINCTVAHNSAEFSGAGVNDAAQGGVIYNTVFWHNGAEHQAGIDGGATMSYDLQHFAGWGSFDGVTPVVDFEGSPDPSNCFEAPTTIIGNVAGMTSDNIGNWLLKPSSPLIDMGDDALNLQSLDIVKNQRKQGIIDIGAYEQTPVQVTSISITDTEHTFDGTAKGVSVTVTPDVSYIVEYREGTDSYSTTLPSGAGNYDVRVTITQQGYTGEETATLTINKASVSGVTFSDGAFDYDTSAKTIEISGSLPPGASVTYVDNTKTDAGTYNAVANIDGGDNYNNETLNADLIINPKSLTVDVGAVSKIYDGSVTADTPTLTLSEGIAAGEVFASDWGAVDVSATLATYVDKNVGTSKTVNVSGIALTGIRSDNYTIGATASNSASSITSKELTISGVTADNKVYDATTAATLSGTSSLDGVEGTDDVALVNSDNNAFAQSDAGTGIVVSTNFDISGTDASNYSLSQPSLSADITPAPLSVTFPSVEKVYDGNTDAPVPVLTVAGAQGGETVTASGTSAAYSNKDVGTGKTVTVSGITFSAPSNDNYSLSSTASNNDGVITARDVTGSLTISFPDQSKVYDGTTDVPAIDPADFSLSGLIGTDDVSVDSYTDASYDDKHAGDGNKTVTVTGITFTGTDVDNYTLPGTADNSTSTITPMPVTITVDPDQGKTYDNDPANPAAYTYTATSLPAGDTYEGALTRVPGENVSSYAINQGTLVPATTGEASEGANYNVTFVSGDFVITPKKLTITDLTADDKVYDATADASFTGGTLNGVVTGDNVSFNYTAQFDDKNVGVNKPVTAAFSLSGGSEVNNYSLTEPSGFSADITPRELELFGFSIADRAPAVGDFSADIEDWGTLRTIPDPDIGSVSVNKVGVTATFPSDEAGTYIVTVSTIGLEGPDASNYTLKQPVDPEATISTDLPTFDWSAQPLETTYNGQAYPVAVEETHNNTAATVEYDHGDGNGWVSGVPIDAGNYLVRATSTDATYVGDQTKALTINKKSIPAATFGTGTKVYDNTTNVDPQPVLVLLGIETRDEATVTATGSAARYVTKDVGTNKTVTITDVTLSGTGAGNYTIPDVATNSTWSITKLDYNDVPLEFSFDDQEKVFDGTTSVKKDGVETIPSITIAGFLAGDSFTATAASAAYDTPQAGSGKTVTLSGITYSDNATDNYDLPSELINDKSVILKLSIDDLGGASMTIAHQTKVYDGTTDVKDGAGDVYIPEVNFSGLITGFTDVTAVGSSASYDDKNVGANKSVTVEGLTFGGADAVNYDFPSTVVNSNSSITPVSVSEIPGLEVVFDAQSKVYDGTTDVKDASGTVYVPALTINGLITGDVVTATGTLATYDTKDAGDTKTVTITDVVYTGADADNYTLPNEVDHANNSITPVSVSEIPGLEVVFDAQSKVYDGTTDVKDASGTVYVPSLAINGLITGDIVAATGTQATYDSKNVGDSKTVTITDVVYSGTDAGNYTLPNQVENANNSIIPVSVSEIPGLEVVFDAQSKVYDGTTDVKDASGTVYVPSLTINGLITGDVVTATGTLATYDTKDAGDTKTVTITDVVYTGADAGNYTLPNQVANANNSITPVSVSEIPGLEVVFDAQSKVYDGTTDVKDASGTVYVPSLTINGLITGDIVAATGTQATYDSKNVGDSKTVTITDVVYSGTDAGNYTLPNQVANNNSSITPVSVVDIPGLEVVFDAQTKVYDGTTDVKNASGTIYVPALTINGLITGDIVTATGTLAAYDTKDVGDSKTVILTDVVYSGTDAGNYNLPNEVVNTNNSITPASFLDIPGLEVVFDAQSKVYDGTTDVKDASGTVYVPSLTINGLITGDVVAATGDNAAYDTKDAGDTKTVTITDVVYTGADVGNYTLPNQVENANNSITPVSVSEIPDLEVVFDAQSKVYDGTTDVKDASGTVYVPSLTINGLITGDVVTATGSMAAYDTKDAGDSKTVRITGVGYSGAEADNYELPTVVAQDNSSIGPKPITIIPAEGQEKDFNDEEMNLDFEVEPRMLDNSILIKDELTGALSWSGSRELGSYEIGQGTLTNENNPNYDIVFYQGITFLIGSDVNVIRKWGYMLLVNNADDAFVGYQWFRDGVEMPGETNQYYSPESKSLCGVYSCRVELADGTTIMSPDYEFLDGCGSTKSVSVFPNPVKSEEAIFVNQEGTDGFEEGDYLLEIYSAQGQLVEWQRSTHLNRVKLSAPASSGAYLVRISMGGKELGVIKILVID